jgi:hypothetical protein
MIAMLLVSVPAVVFPAWTVIGSSGGEPTASKFFQDFTAPLGAT